MDKLPFIFAVFSGVLAGVLSIIISVLRSSSTKQKVSIKQMETEIKRLETALEQQKKTAALHTDAQKKLQAAKQKSNEKALALEKKAQEPKKSEKPIEDSIKVANDIVSSFSAANINK